MHFDKTALRSKLGRRLFGLFVVCALLPITILAFISFWNVNSQLRLQTRRELRQASHEEGMAIYERLTFLDQDLNLIAARLGNQIGQAPTAALPANLNRRFRWIVLSQEQGTSTKVLGTPDQEIIPTSEDLVHLRSGKTVLTSRTCVAANTSCLFLIRPLENRNSTLQYLIGRIQSSFVLDPENVPENKNICAFDEHGLLVRCSGEVPASLAVDFSRSSSGQFQWSQNGQEFQADYWNVFVKPVFLADHLTIVASEATSDVLLPLARFKRIFLLIILLALLVVLLLTLVQIRRNLVPLGRLQEGTRAVARGEFQARVYVRGGDEFHDLALSFNSMAGQLEKQFEALTVKSAIDRAVLSAWDIDQIIGTLFSRLHKLLPYQLATVTLLDSESPHLAAQHLSWGAGGKHETRTISLTDADLQQLTIDSEIELATSDTYHPQFLAALASRNMRYFLVAPILLNGKISAFICVGHSEQPRWNNDDRSLLRQIADQVGVAFSNARLVSDLKDLSWGTLAALARTIDAKSPWTSGHSERVTAMALKIAHELRLSPEDLDIIHRGGLLHDIGKLGIPSEILDKPGKLTPEEMAIMQSHVVIGARILEPITSFKECLPVVLQHHEWINGNGYPYGLKGDEITLHSRIFAVADCYDALISDRPYRAGMPLSKVLEILTSGVGKQFDPPVMDAFLRVIDREKEPQTPATVAPVAAV